MLGRPILTTDQLQGHVTQLSQQDIIWNPLYDDGKYTGTNGQTSLSFFQSPQGQGTTLAPSATGTKNIYDTNLTGAGQLTKGNAFYMTGQELLFFPERIRRQPQRPLSIISLMTCMCSAKTGH